MTLPALQDLLGKDVVLDTKSPLIFLGRLVAADENLFTLEEADVHDASGRQTSKEVYILEARRHGIKKNRHRVLVRADEVVSISLLEEVIKY